MLAKVKVSKEITKKYTITKEMILDLLVSQGEYVGLNDKVDIGIAFTYSTDVIEGDFYDLEEDGSFDLQVVVKTSEETEGGKEILDT